MPAATTDDSVTAATARIGMVEPATKISMAEATAGSAMAQATCRNSVACRNAVTETNVTSGCMTVADAGADDVTAAIDMTTSDDMAAEVAGLTVTCIHAATITPKQACS